MLNSKLRNFLTRNLPGMMLACIIFFAVFFSASTLLTRPRIWTDESQTLELSRSFLQSGVLNAQTSPGHFFEYPYLLQSTGYPLTVIMSGLFSLFGYDFAVARIAMLIFMTAVLVAVFFVASKLFCSTKAILSVYLLASAASFYGGGRTAVGEVPGFLFLLLFIYFWRVRNFNFLGGLFLGLAVVTKPSVFLLAVPALLLTLLMERRRFFRTATELFSAMILPALGWVFFVLGNPFSGDAWLRILNFYRNPYGSGNIIQSFYLNLANFFHSTTLVYFGILLLCVAVAGYLSRKKDSAPMYYFIVSYSLFAFLYYLKSPGWLRYILIAEFLIFFILPDAAAVILAELADIFKKPFPVGKIYPAVMLFLTGAQLFHLFTGAQMYSSDSALKVSAYINKNFPGWSVGIVDAMSLSVLLKTNLRYQTFELQGIPRIGKNFLSENQHPDIAVLTADSALSSAEKNLLIRDYSPVSDMDGYEIYYRLRRDRSADNP